MISQRAKYALHALIALASARSLLSTSEIAESEQIPSPFLEQILMQLKHHGILTSKRGRFGGYDLLLPAEGITFGHILRIIDGPIAPLACLSRTAYRRCSDCRSEESCKVRRVFARVVGESRSILDQTTIADALAEVRSDNEAVTPMVPASLSRPSPRRTAH
jgi:Rrf2 family protein